jgi:DNA transformation protein
MPADTFAEFVADQLEGMEGLEIKRMFGGQGLYLKKSFFGILFSGKLYFKTHPGTLPQYLDQGSKPFVYAKKGKKTIRLKNYYEVPVDILEDRKALKAWAREAVEGNHG